MSYDPDPGRVELKPSNARVLKANAAYGQGGRLPGIHTSRTPRAANYPRAPVPGMPAETLDFTQWNPSDEINNVRWRLEVERDWQQRQEEKRKREVARQRREAIALAGEIKATKELQKKQMEEAAVGMQKDQAAHLEYLAQCERAQTAQQNDLLAWNRQEREEERLRLKEEAKAEKAELLRRMEEAKKVGKELDQDPAPMELSTPRAKVQKQELESEQEELRWLEQKYRQAKQIDEMKRAHEAELQQQEARLKVIEVQDQKQAEEEKRKQGRGKLNSEAKRAAQAARKATEEDAARLADQLAWKAAMIGKPGTVKPAKPTSARRAGAVELRRRFLGHTDGERLVIGAPVRKHKWIPKAPQTKMERLAAEEARIESARNKVLQERSNKERELAEEGARMRKQVGVLQAQLETARMEATKDGNDLNAARQARRNAKEQAAADLARRQLQLAEAAQAKAAERLENKAAAAIEAAREAEAQAVRVAADLEHERQLRQKEIAAKTEATHAHIRGMNEERAAVEMAEYEAQLAQLKRDEEERDRLEKEAAVRRAEEAHRRRQIAMQREEARVAAAQRALEKAQDVVAAYEVQEKATQAKIQRKRDLEKIKKSDTDARLGAVLEEQRKRRAETEAEFHRNEENARTIKQALDKQQEMDRQRAVQQSIEKIAAMKAANAAAAAERAKLATEDEAFALKRSALAGQRRTLLAEQHETKAAAREKQRQHAYYRASQDQAQELERVRIGMLAKGKEVPPPLFTHADNQPKGHHSGFGAKMPRGCGAVNNFSEPQ